MANVTLEKVGKTYGKHRVISDLSVTIQDGECFTFLGPSGCGKTVILRLIAGFEHLTAGEIFIGDRLVSSVGKDIHLPPEERKIGVVFQDYAVWPHKTVYENIVYPLQIQKIPTARQKNGRWPLQPGQPGRPGNPAPLSALRRPAAAGRSGPGAHSRPEIMLLDEPLSNLDANLREEMRFEITALQKQTGVTILYVTHDQEVALAISDRVAVMDNTGRIRQIGPPDDIYEHPWIRLSSNSWGFPTSFPSKTGTGRYSSAKGCPARLSVPGRRRDRLRRNELIAGCRPYDIELTRDKTAPPGGSSAGDFPRVDDRLPRRRRDGRSVSSRIPGMPAKGDSFPGR